MLKILPIKQIVLTEGSLVGTPCTMVAVSEKGEDMEVNDILQKVLECPLRNVLVKGKLIDNTNIQTVIEGLISKGKIIYYITDASDVIETVRRQRNIIFCLRLNPPSDKKNDVDPRNLPLLQDLDEIFINVKSVKEYENAKAYVRDRIITKPTVYFRISDKAEAKDIVDLVALYLKDSEKFKFKTKLINIHVKPEN
jgi:hypothetical protein